VNVNTLPVLSHHGLLVAWGIFAQQLGLVDAIKSVPLHQKRREHTPQTKVLEYLLALLAGLPHLQDISRAAHPLDKDMTVATAWGQLAWADYSGVSRTLSSLTDAEVDKLIGSLTGLSQDYIDREVAISLSQEGVITYDADLTGRSVSDASRTYPDAAFGRMGDQVRLGYQAAVVSMESPTYNRLWLSTTLHPGNTVSCDSLQALVQAAEAATGVRPRRRTELLQERLDSLHKEMASAQTEVEKARQAVEAAERACQETADKISYWQEQFAHYEGGYAERGRIERPHSRLAQARRRLAVQEKRLVRRQQLYTDEQRRLRKRIENVSALKVQHQTVADQLAQLEADNANNPNPVRARFRIDAGFGTHENVDWLIEMGYEIYTKPFSHWVTKQLSKQVTDNTSWLQVGGNAEMTAWPAQLVGTYTYPLDVALARYHQGQTVRNSSFLYYGNEAVTDDLAQWFATYNRRQSIEAGIKEGKRIFQLHHFKVRSAPALRLQEFLTSFAANFIRWGLHWLQTQASWQGPSDAQSVLPPSWTNVKHAVQVLSHTSALVQWCEQGCLLKFTEQSCYPGAELRTGSYAFQPPLPLFKSSDFQHF